MTSNTTGLGGFYALDGGATFPLRHRIERGVWHLSWLLLASWTPPQFRSWRRLLLKLFGARLGHRADVRGSARIWLPRNLEMHDYAVIGPRVNCYNMAPIILYERALVSQGAHLCTGSHQIDDPAFMLVTRPITIETGAWVAADAFVAPGVTVGARAVLGARGVALRNLEPGWVYIGNPAVKRRERGGPPPITGLR